MIVGYFDHESNSIITTKNFQKQILGRDEMRADLTRFIWQNNMVSALIGSKKVVFS